MSGHHCHALGCKNKCPTAWLMCRSCWSKVPLRMQSDVYRTCRMRGPDCDSSWAPWWRAQAHAIHHVAMLEEPDAEKGRRWLDKELRIADGLEDRR